jgi:leucyl aminopeptidase (aminopeptidase T)
MAAFIGKEEIGMARFEFKEEYTFTVEAATGNEATSVLERFHVEEDKIIYGSNDRLMRVDGLIKVDRSNPRCSF